MTTCEYPDSVRAYECITEEQCDECFLVDHLAECNGCEHYDHPTRDMPGFEGTLEALSKLTIIK
jgi:hypothetical protein